MKAVSIGVECWEQGQGDFIGTLINCPWFYSVYEQHIHLFASVLQLRIWKLSIIVFPVHAQMQN